MPPWKDDIWTVNHSRKRHNIRPRLYTMEEEGLQTDVILFIADRDIKVGEELLFNYGVNRNSFRGESLDLEWLA